MHFEFFFFSIQNTKDKSYSLCRFLKKKKVEGVKNHKFTVTGKMSLDNLYGAKFSSPLFNSIIIYLFDIDKLRTKYVNIAHSITNDTYKFIFVQR